MLLEKWLELSKSEQEVLTQKFGLTRRGPNNEVAEEELQKVQHLLVPVEQVEEIVEPVKEMPLKKGKKSKK